MNNEVPLIMRVSDRLLDRWGKSQGQYQKAYADAYVLVQRIINFQPTQLTLEGM